VKKIAELMREKKLEDISESAMNPTATACALLWT